ncbi:hypothetical protein [Mongoliimonas terrestris]|uniref:hypothetical protein n=1 Tax=Mongoliimonas terrestris TaxID=1709001 RepID=UPI0011153D18|nr:hypothetical protein [Mongoliimonas terrestris]
MTVEKAVAWAYCEGLTAGPVHGGGILQSFGPGRIVGGHEAASMVARLWALPDNVFGVLPDPTKLYDEPNPDAVKIHEAVQGLDKLDVTMPEAWCGFEDVELYDCRPAVEAAVRAGVVAMGGKPRRRMSQVICTAAILGLPDLRLDAPERRVQTRANGQPRWFRRVAAVDACGLPYDVELDGYDARAKRPFEGAYQKPYLDPDPVGVLVDRCWAELWRAALDELHEVLAGTLDEIDLLPSALPIRPWEATPARVLPDLVTPRRRQPMRIVRPVAGPLWKGSKRNPENA